MKTEARRHAVTDRGIEVLLQLRGTDMGQRQVGMGRYGRWAWAGGRVKRACGRLGLTQSRGRKACQEPLDARMRHARPVTQFG